MVTDQRKKTKIVPVVVSAMAQPFVSAAIRSGVEVGPLLEDAGVSRADMQDGTTIMSGQAWYNLIDQIAKAVQDPTLGFQIGSEAALATLPNLRNLRTKDATLGNLLTTMVIEAESLTSLADYELLVQSRAAVLRSRRTFRPTSPPSQADGYFAGFLYRVLRLCCGEKWDPSKFEMRICDLKSLPQNVAADCKAFPGPISGVQFGFPSPWLLLQDEGRRSQEPAEGDVRNSAFMSQFLMLLELHRNDPKLTLQRFASFSSLGPSELKRELARHKTTFHRELDAARLKRARTLLVETEMSMTEVGVQVGFPDSSGFCRAFKRWEGITPGRFRENNRKNVARLSNGE